MLARVELPELGASSEWAASSSSAQIGGAGGLGDRAGRAWGMAMVGRSAVEEGSWAGSRSLRRAEFGANCVFGQTWA
jgi:hypothetical protein